ncbi:MAG: cysteine-rich CWC family protein [Pyrinomonadaceae bacterium]
MMTPQPFGQSAISKNCSACGAEFRCGLESSESCCWCEQLPHVELAGSADQDCLCPACLMETISKSRQPGSKIEAKQRQLVEGEDFYWEGAAMVFTAQFLLRRGSCCDSGCRHCPYQKDR